MTILNDHATVIRLYSLPEEEELKTVPSVVQALNLTVLLTVDAATICLLVTKKLNTMHNDEHI